MITRAIQHKVQRSLKSFPAVGLIGPRQVGKTTLAKMIVADTKKPVLFLDLESPADLAKLTSAELLLERYRDRFVVIDEAQQKPELFPLLRVLIDRHSRPGRFLILGSASPSLKRQASESLAGRIVYHELSPLTLAEVDEGSSEKNISRLWARGGYPRSYLAANDAVSSQWRASFIQTYLERDMPMLGIRVPATTLRRFWMMVAHCHGQTWNASRIAESMGIDSKTARHYMDILSDTFMLRQLAPCHANVKKRLIKSPKVYIRCTGLLHSLLGVTDWEALQGHPIRGQSWECFCIEQIAAAIPGNWEMSFYRTQSGAEMDLAIHPAAMKPPIAVEIKSSTAPTLTKGNWSAIEDLAPRVTYVVYPGRERYPLARNVEVLPVAQVAQIAKESV